ncbi:ABC transporter ATP-binding protein [Nocardioides agariphilus]|jgi:iron(III) transport system ATP-binding protein|uniref:ABC transporter ATP-binding protein n=1 Tax=Nocardioides agariphilus TaxID=433664 RepID=A0A930YI60_9ACTN|nr:ABC transporter ATP-binding protein [Nocardioides agariphilus]MBF4769391.1 ABC transporter ATP-binding protein [Nocardioides agariphilus]
MNDVSLSVIDLFKRYPGADEGVNAVDGVSFDVEEGQFYTLLGPSGCGKTTTLRCVAGLERTDSGTIVLGGRPVNQVTPKIFVRPEERDIGMVFQSYAIWPHMTVFENVAFPLRGFARSRKHLRRTEINERVTKALETVQLGAFAERPAPKLSGGQQQRLALARALALEPKLLLLDEPLSNLDASLRELMRTELRRLQRQVGVTTLYVTHDQQEALSMSNRVAVMENGKIVQAARPREIYRRPITKFVASFVGRTNLMDVTIIGKGQGDHLRLDTPAGVVEAICPADIRDNDEALLSVRPENIQLHAARPPEGTPNVYPGMVEYVLFLGESCEYQVRVGHQQLICRVNPDIVFRRRDDVFVELPTEHCVVVSDEHGTTPETRQDEEDDDDEFETFGVDPLSAPLESV